MTTEVSKGGSEGSANVEISIRLNGDNIMMPRGSTLRDLLDRLGKDPRTVAIEHGGSIVPRSRYDETVLEDGDVLEIVHFVQGGASSKDGS